MGKATVKDKHDGTLLAQAEMPQGVFELEGNLYFAPEHVKMERLVVTERTYTCPYKGICYWLDLESPSGKVTNVAWVYRDPKKGYERIQNRIAFYQGNRQGTISEKV
jgi:uncharacterized protein (DUF427 family)